MPTIKADFSGKVRPSVDSTPLAETEDFVKILYHGEPGTGKTTALAGLARLGKVYYVNAEAGLKAKPLRRMGIPIENIEVYPKKGESITFEGMENLFWSLKAMLEDDPTSLAGVLLDSLTEIQKKFLDNIVQKAVDKADGLGMERNRFQVERNEWGVNTEQMRLLIRQFRDLPCHVGMATQSRRDQDDDGEVSYGPALTPALQGDVVGYCDIVIATQVEAREGGKDLFFGQTRRVGKYTAKDRYGLLPRKLVTPSFDRVISYVAEELTSTDDPLQVAERERRRKP